MQNDSVSEGLEDIEISFRRRLAAKLVARGYAGAALDEKVEELLRKGLKLRLNVDEILNGPSS